MAYVYELLKDDYNVVSCFYNPNITPMNEYNKRLHELQQFTEESGIELITGSYDTHSWTKKVKPYRFLGERSQRCWICYRIRLDKTFCCAHDKGIDLVATTLSISPHKSAERINSIGKELEKKFGIEFLIADFKKNDGFRKSVELSNKYSFYRQNYCGCIYSKMEREKNSLWYKKFSDNVK